MNKKEIAMAINFIKPNTEWVLRENELEWLDENQTKPTKAEIEAGWVAYQTAQADEAETKATAKAALLDRLGITPDEAKLLLGGN